jgi:hypothetical protein
LLTQAHLTSIVVHTLVIEPLNSVIKLDPA